MDHPENITTLMNVLNSPIAEDNRLCEAARYLRISGDKRVIASLYKRLVDKNDAHWTRVELVNAMSGLVTANQLNIPQVNQLLLSLLSNKSEAEEVKEAAIIALGDLGDRQAVEPLINLLNRSITNDQSSLTYTCVNTLGQLKDARSVPVLIRRLSSKEERITKFCTKILGEFGQEAFSALPKLTDLENSYRGFEREAAHDAVLKIKKAISSGIR